MKLKKIFKIVLGTFGALMLLIVITMLFWLGPTVKLVAEAVGSKALGTSIRFEKLKINPVKGIIHLSDFAIKNPHMFGQSNAVSLTSLDISIDMGSLFSSTVVVHQVEINSPHFIYEQNLSSDNISEFITSIQHFAEIDPSAPPKPKKKKENDARKEPKVFIVESLAIKDVQFNLANTDDNQLDFGAGFDQLTISMTNGAARLDNFYVTNPGRLKTPHLFTLDGIDLLIEPGSIYSSTIKIEAVQISKPYVFLELNTETDTVSEFLKIAHGCMSRMPSDKSAQRPPAQDSPAAEEPVKPKTPANAPPPIELHSLVVDDIELQLLDLSDTNSPAAEPHMIAGIGEIALKLLEGKLQINNIRIPNTEGFAASNILYLANIDVAIEPDSIYTDQFIINSVLINSPRVNLEQTETAGNVSTLQSTLMQFAPTPEELPTVAAAPEPPKNKQPVAKTKERIPLAEQPVVLQQLQVSNLNINLSLPASTTEEFSASHLNPISNLSLKTLNPLSKDSSKTNAIKEVHALMELVAFDQLSLEPLNGLLLINNLRISNPPEFSKNNLIQIEEFRIDLDPDTILSDTLHIEDIMIMKPHIRYERQLSTDNIKALQMEIQQAVMHRAEQKAGDPNSTAVAELQTAEADASSEKQKVIIDHVLISKGMVQAKLSALPAISVPLYPPIELKDLGKAEGGTSIAEARNTIFNSLYDAVIGVVGGATGFAGDTLKGIGNLTFDTLGSATEGVTSGIGTMATTTKGALTGTAEKVKEKRRKRRAGGRRRLF